MSRAQLIDERPEEDNNEVDVTMQPENAVLPQRAHGLGH